MEQQIKSIRENIDHLMTQSKHLSSNRELSLAYTNMQRGFMWLGLVLGALNQPNPYPKSTDVSSPVIEDRTDQAKNSINSFTYMPSESRTASVKWFRGNIQTLVEAIPTTFTNSDANEAATVAIQALKEAKMWFGWELNNILISRSGA